MGIHSLLLEGEEPDRLTMNPISLIEPNDRIGVTFGAFLGFIFGLVVGLLTASYILLH
jgi:hypothetical protein